MKGFYLWDVADLNFPTALEDQSVLSDTFNVTIKNGQMELFASRDAEDTTENPPKHTKAVLTAQYQAVY